MSLHRYLGGLRIVLVLVGLGLFAAGLNTVASIPAGPSDGDGFLEGLAYALGLLSSVAGLVVVQIGFAVPAGGGRVRDGPLADRSAAFRGGTTVLAYVLTVLVMVYGVPVVVPRVTESTTYATGLFSFAIAAVVGVLVTLLLALGGLATRIYRRHAAEDASRPTN